MLSIESFRSYYNIHLVKRDFTRYMRLIVIDT